MAPKVKTQFEAENDSRKAGFELLNEYKGAHNKYNYKCLICNKTLYSTHSNIISQGHSCHKKKRASVPSMWAPKGESGFNTYYQKYKCSAKHKQLEFNLTKEIFRKIVLSNCYWCNSTPIEKGTIKNRSSKNRTITSLAHKNADFGPCMGIDRLDSNKGYIEGNVVSCCTECNYFKSDYSDIEFKQLITKIYLNIESRNY